MQLSSLLTRLQPKRKVLIIGSVLADVLVKVDTMPVSGGDLTGHDPHIKIGGCSFNAADVLVKLGLPLTTLLPIGEGPWARTITAEFMRRKLNPCIFEGCGDNGWCLTLIEPNGERTFITMPGIETHFNPQWLQALDIASYDLIYLSGYQTEGENGEVIVQSLQAMRQDARLIYDPGPRTPYISQRLLNKLEALPLLYAVNEHEAQQLTAKATPAQAAWALAARTCGQAVVTCGAAGAICVDGGKIEKIPSFNITPIDTVGSGDAHSGGLMAGLMCNLSLNEATLLANACAASVTAQEGAACCGDRTQLRHLPGAEAELMPTPIPL